MFNLTFFGMVYFIGFLIIMVILYLVFEFYNAKKYRIYPIIGIIIALIIAIFSSWYNTNTADGQRSIKNDKSNMEGGLDRKITIWYYEKDEPIVFEGKIDLQDKDDNKVLEFILDGKKYIYYVGILDRYIVEEK